VVGIVETGSTYEDGGAIISLSEAQQLLKKPHQVMLMSIKLKDPAQTEVVRARLAAEYPKLVFARSAEFTENLSDMENMRVMFNAIFLLTLLVGSIALMNTMVMSIYERTREIGVLRAVGWRASMVLREMLAESLILTLSSGALGFVSAWLLIAGMRAMPSLGVMRESFAITPVVAGEALALCLVLGVVGGLYPAWRATRLSPVEALRYE
jgi:ABC-type antimicrobial peptide transport system permease subunit